MIITVLSPDRLRSAPQRGVRVEEDWDRIVAWTSTPVVTNDKASEGGFVFADLRDGIRRKDHVRTVSAIAVDHDAGAVTPERAFEALRRHRRLVYTTHSHETERPRWRAVIDVSRPMTPSEHASVIERVMERMADAGVAVDRACSDPSRLWYAPATRPRAPFVHLAGDGDAFDVDRLLGTIPTTKTPAARLPITPADHRDAYLRSAMEKAAQAVASAPKGTRNATLNKEAYALARLNLSDVEIAGVLAAAARTCGLPRVEIDKTIASALRARRGAA